MDNLSSLWSTYSISNNSTDKNTLESDFVCFFIFCSNFSGSCVLAITSAHITASYLPAKLESSRKSACEIFTPSNRFLPLLTLFVFMSIPLTSVYPSFDILFTSIPILQPTSNTLASLSNVETNSWASVRYLEV